MGYVLDSIVATLNDQRYVIITFLLVALPFIVVEICEYIYIHLYSYEESEALRYYKRRLKFYKDQLNKSKDDIVESYECIVLEKNIKIEAMRLEIIKLNGELKEG